MASIRVCRLRKKAVAFAGAVLTCISAWRQAKKEFSAADMLRPKKEDAITMKKSTFAAIVIFLSAAGGALVAAYLYIQGFYLEDGSCIVVQSAGLCQVYFKRGTKVGVFYIVEDVC